MDKPQIPKKGNLVVPIEDACSIYVIIVFSGRLNEKGRGGEGREIENVSRGHY